MLALILIAQLNASPARPTAHAVPAGPRSLADVARERSLRTGGVSGVRPTPIVLDLPTPAPFPTYRAHSLEELDAVLGPRPTVPPMPALAVDPAFTPIAVERSSADAVSDLGKKAGLFGVGLVGLFVIGSFFLVWAFSPWIGLRIGRSKGYPDWAGALAGLFLGPFVLLMALISRSSKKYPFCLSNIPIKATVCARCQREQPKEAGA
jgi:hypothetical protein